ncbi:hypothetical protein ACWJJH_16030 [Endozoicomonadaceae bacterium StTr2]
MKRLYFLTNQIDDVDRISADLHRQGITDWNFHVVSKDAAKLKRRKIHGANLFHELDIIHCGEQGAAIGGIIGAAIAATLYHSQFFGPEPSWMALGFIVVLFGFFGAWSGGLVGIARENYKISRFHDALEAGQYLIMVDTSRAEEASVRRHLAYYYPQVDLAGSDSTIINPFVMTSTSRH